MDKTTIDRSQELQQQQQQLYLYGSVLRHNLGYYSLRTSPELTITTVTRHQNAVDKTVHDADLEVTSCVQQQVAWLQVTMQDVGRMYVLEPTKDLIEEIAYVIVTKLLCLEQLVHVRLH